METSRADLGITAAVAVLTCAAAAVGAPVAVMTVFGVLLFAAPGYLLARLLLGSRGTGLERVAAAIGLALCVPVLGGLLLYAAGLPVHRAAWLSLLAGVTLACDLALFLRRRRRPEPAGREQAAWRRPGRHAAAFGAAAVIAVGAVGLGRAGVAMQHYSGYTQLWLNRPGAGAPAIDIGVGNHEGRTMRYLLVLTGKGHRAGTWNLVLANGQAWHHAPRYPAGNAISVNLFRLPDVTHPYRHVALDAEGAT
jgi:uncharacterized membrane protein